MTNTEYHRRQRTLLHTIGRSSVVIVPAARESIRNRDVHYPFRQHSDFSYLTGFPEPHALAVFVPKRKAGEFILFCQPRDPEREQWDGTRIGIEGAVADFGADQAYPLSELDTLMPTLIDGCARVYYPIGHDAALDQQVMGWVRQVRAKVRTGAIAPDIFINLDSVLHEQRLIKTRVEIAILRQAARIAAHAHCRMMQRCAPGITELALEADFQHTCAIAGARFNAYPTIVGGGANACILHYTANNAVLSDGDLVLIDAGCELNGYASDITRTFPVNGRFTPSQRELYQLVLRAQLAAIDAAQPGNRWNEPHDAAVRVLTKGLIRLGILSGKVNSLIKEEAYKPYYMHRTGHWLGMDVHDVGAYQKNGEWRPLEPGMVLTIEPGLYLPDNEALPESYRNIGIRIEDDILITKTGNEVLSAAVPKHPDAIEALMTHHSIETRC
ncbi:Xaa-Pro aminopeptidase [Chromatium okenii]|jgi:Xaa-Pro aminopeptidase|uniref:Xaa-Pro aminopeptidase n=1 Tax=Chromatium okenii TaxID=61644 RepID=A0A2S7XR67_9GAMM|nr:Xaa-Pro aminopeptidase [Chromatium okenii]MBV5308054.1 Xaa-Pro aminopeptidase [Chromatium okenii]PQJ96229.1 Xaa-Pro aminopeptidase [Chromatium okenii]